MVAVFVIGLVISLVIGLVIITPAKFENDTYIVFTPLKLSSPFSTHGVKII